MKKPKAAPASSSSFCTRRKARGRKVAMSAAASVNLTARNTNTETWSREFFTMTKVLPQRREHKASERSARKDLVIGRAVFLGLLGLQATDAGCEGPADEIEHQRQLQV